MNSSQSSAPAPEPTRPSPSRTPSPEAKPGEVTLTGTVELRDIEGGCLVLHAGSVTYELSGGDRTVLKDGAQVTVRGIVRKDLMTICQMGTVLEVISSRPA